MNIKRNIILSLSSMLIILCVAVPTKTVKAGMVTYIKYTPIVVTNYDDDDEDDKPITWVDFTPIIAGVIICIGCKIWSDH